MPAPRNCEVTTSDGTYVAVQADGFTLLDNGFVLLKRYVEATPTVPAHEKTVAVFNKPVAVLLGDDTALPNTPGLKAVAEG